MWGRCAIGDAVEGQSAHRWGKGDDSVNAQDVEDVDVCGEGDHHRLVVPPPRRVFPNLKFARAETGEEQLYGPAAKLVVE